MMGDNHIFLGATRRSRYRGPRGELPGAFAIPASGLKAGLRRCLVPFEFMFIGDDLGEEYPDEVEFTHLGHKRPVAGNAAAEDIGPVIHLSTVAGFAALRR